MWQRFLGEQGAARFALLSVAVDTDPQRVRPFADGLPFPTAVDSVGALGRLLDFDVVPNGLFLDEAGVVRLLHVGGFDIRRPEVAEQVRALVAAPSFDGGPASGALRQESLDIEVLRTELVERPGDAGLHFALGEALAREARWPDAEAAFRRAAGLDQADWSAPFALGTALDQQGRREDALAAWRDALARDPKNFTVRKQIWKTEHPERFYPEIDLDWQREQLTREGYSA